MDLFDSFINLFIEFINDLEDTFPQHEVLLQNVRKYITKTKNQDATELLESKWTVISQFRSVSTKYTEQLTNQDSNMFKGKEPIEFILGLDFRSVWDDNLTDTNKNAIMKYLHLLNIMAINLDEEKVLNGMTTENPVMGMIEMMTGMNGSGGQVMDPDQLQHATNTLLDQLNLGDNATGAALKEIIGDVSSHVSEMMQSGQNPLTLLTGLLDPNAAQNNTQLGNLMENITNKMKTKIDMGEIKEEELAGATNNIMETLQKSTNLNIPGLPNLQQLGQQLGQQLPNNPNEMPSMQDMMSHLNIPGFPNLQQLGNNNPNEMQDAMSMQDIMSHLNIEQLQMLNAQLDLNGIEHASFPSPLRTTEPIVPTVDSQNVGRNNTRSRASRRRNRRRRKSRR